jgi:hypothetical protein
LDKRRLPAPAASATATAARTRPAITARGASAGTARTALGLGACLVDDEVAVAKEAAIQHLDGLAGLFLRRHLDEAEAPGAARELVRDDANGLDGSGLLEQLTQIFFRGLKGKVPDEELGRHRAILLPKSGDCRPGPASGKD